MPPPMKIAPAVRLVLAGLLLLPLAAPTYAQWVWRDQNRQLHASDRPPPPEVPDKDIIQRPPGIPARPAPASAPRPADAASPPAPAVVADAPPRSDPALEARRRAAEQEKKASEADATQKADAARKDSCARARSYMQTLDSGIRIARTNAQGEREILDDAARAQEVQRTKDVIARDCR